MKAILKIERYEFLLVSRIGSSWTKTFTKTTIRAGGEAPECTGKGAQENTCREVLEGSSHLGK